MKFIFLIKHGFLTFTLCAFLFPDLKGQNAIQDKIDWAFSNGLTEVTIPPGTYTVPFNSGVGAHLSISGKKNLTINASGVTMICSQRGSAIFINKSEVITINNLNIDYDPLPFTQGTIVDYGVLGTVPYVDVIIHSGYTTATAITGQCNVEIYDATTRLIRSNIWTIYSATIEPLDLSINKFRIHNTKEFTGNTVIGDLVTLDFPSVNAHGIRIEKSKKITIGNVNLFAAPVFGIYEFLCDSNYYHDVNIVPGPLPNGATQPRLKSATADGIHSTSAKTGPKIENCRIENIGDDGIAIHGLYDYAVYASGTKLGVRTRWGSSDIYVGDSIYNLNNDGTINFRAKVLSVSSPSSSEAISMNNNWNSLGFTDKGYFDSNYILNLDRAVSIVNGTAVNSLGSQGNGFDVRNNYIHNKSARGILIKSSDGIIENNTIDWITMAGIVLAPEYYWMEAGFSRNVKIINNTLRNCGINPSFGGVQSGTISVVAESKDYKFSLAKIQQNIEISGNHFYSCLGTNILVSSASKFNISNNVFDLPNIDHRSNGSNLGINGQFVVWLQNGDSISLFNNRVVCRPDVYLLNPGNSTHITGLSDGVLCYQNGTGVIGKGMGLCGKYYNGINFNTLIGNRLDQQVYFNWGVNKPMENVTKEIILYGGLERFRQKKPANILFILRQVMEENYGLTILYSLTNGIAVRIIAIQELLIW
jgi:hypothetical protein